MRVLALTSAALLLAACGNGDGKGDAKAASGEPVRHQPGSWSNKIEIVKLDAGPGVDSAKIRGGMQQIFDAASGTSICITPELAAKDNPAANLERLAAQGKKCDFTRKVATGDRIDYAGTCTDPNGSGIRIAITGTNGATAQDLTVTSAPVDPSGATKGSMTMHLTSRRLGDCKPGDVTPALPGNAAG